MSIPTGWITTVEHLFWATENERGEVVEMFLEPEDITPALRISAVEHLSPGQLERAGKLCGNACGTGERRVEMQV